jgi:hypothetical protein
VVYPTLQVVVVLATANHFFLDVLGGGACVLAGYAVVIAIGRLLGRTGASNRVSVPVIAPSRDGDGEGDERVEASPAREAV